MVTGTVCAAVGLLWGRMALRVSPIDTRKDDLGLRDLDHLLQPFEAVDVASEADTRASVLR